MNKDRLNILFANLLAGSAFMSVLILANKQTGAVKAGLIALLAVRLGRLFCGLYGTFGSESIRRFGRITALLAVLPTMPFLAGDIWLIATALSAGIAQSSALIYSRSIGSQKNISQHVAPLTVFGWGLGNVLPHASLALGGGAHINMLIALICASALWMCLDRDSQAGTVHKAQSPVQSEPNPLNSLIIVTFFSIAAGLATILNSHLLPIMKNTFHASDASISLAILAMSVCTFVVSLPSVHLSSLRLSPLNRAILTRVTYGLALLSLLSFAKSIWLGLALIITCIVIGAFEQTAKMDLVSTDARLRPQRFHGQVEIAGVVVGVALYLMTNLNIDPKVQIAALLVVSIFCATVISLRPEGQVTKSTVVEKQGN